MIPVSTLWQEAERRGIHIVWFEMEGRGLYYQDVDLAALGRSIIFLHPVLQRSEVALRTVLSHEIGHDQTAMSTSLLASSQHSQMLDRKNEHLANRWAADFTIGESPFWSFVREHPNICEIAERFGVEPWLADFASREYARRREAADGRLRSFSDLRHESTTE